MATNKEVQKRRLRAQRQADAHAAAAARKGRRRRLLVGGIAGTLAVAMVASLGVGFLAGSDSPDAADIPVDLAEPPPSTDPGASDFVYGEGACPAEDGSDGPRLEFTEPQPLCIDPTADYIAVLDTSEGEIRIDLDSAAVPGTVNNFATLARWGYYDDTLLFRTDPSIAIIQGGSPHTNSPTDPGPGYTIQDEPAFTEGADGNPVGPYRYVPGQIVMARSFGLNSASAQFFFTTGPEAALLDGQGTYVVFGTTDDAGLEILESIIALHVPGENLGGAPSRDVTINSVTIEEV